MKKAITVSAAVAAVCLTVVLIARKPQDGAASNVAPPNAPAAVRVASDGQGRAAVANVTPVAEARSAASVTAAANTPAAKASTRFDWQRITAFNTWAKDFTAATPEQREAMRAEGLRLARERRPEFKKLIVADPQRALEQAVKPVVQQELPAEIVAELEKPVSARGDYIVYMGRPAPGVEMDGRDLVLRYFETPDGASYKARVFGEAEAVMSRKDVAFRGVAIDRELAVPDSAVRPLDVGEKIPAGVTVEQSCPVSGNTTTLEGGLDAPIDARTPAVELAGRVIILCDGSHVRILDEENRLTAHISASGGPGGAHSIKDNFPGTSSESIGNFKALYIRAVYPDRLQAPNTEASAMEDMKNFERFYVESSYGRLSVTPAFTPLIVLPHTREWYEAKDSEVDGLGLVHSHSRREARLLGFDSGQFNVTIVRVNGGPRLSGISWGGGDSVWVSWDGMDVINHECGHSIGRPHANFWNTGGQSAIGIGANAEYGNSFDVMGGGGGFTAHYNTISKRSLGWLPAQNTHNPTVSGVYRIYAYDQPLLEEGRRYGIRVPKDRTRAYNLEYHNNYGIEHTSRVKLRNSALVIWSGFGGAGHLIDTTPGTPDGKTDGGIEVGRTFSDPAAGVHFTVVARNNTSPESLDIAVNYGNPPTNVAPTLALSATATSVAVGGSITFTASATDANGDALAYHWDCGDGYPGTNTAVFTRPFTATDQLTIHCTASDLKGGTTRRHVVVTVGSPGRYVLNGRVTAAGQPVPNVLIGNGSKYAYTDADGYYALPDLTTGAHTINALLYGYSFTPNGDSISIAAGANTLNLTATPLAEVSLAASADASENGTNGAFTLTRTGDTDNPLEVRVMSAAGTATKDTDYSLSPDYVDDGNYRTFTIPAGAASLTVSVVATNDAASEGPETVTLQLAEGTNYVGTATGAATLIIHDDDTTLPQVSITAADTEASELSGNVTAFTVARTGPTAGNLNVALTYGGTATRGVDYPSLPATITIPAGQSSATVILAPINDAAVEGSENVTVTIPTGAAYVLNTAATSVDLLILDDDIPIVTVTAIKPGASETNREPGVFLISRTGSTAAPLKVYYGIGGTASHGTDYVGLPAEVTIPAGAATVPVFITPYDDAHGEGVETVDLLLTVFNGAYLMGSPSLATVTLTDNSDAPHVSVQSTSSTCGEPADTATLRFQLRGSRATATTVRYVLGGTATPGVDYSTNNLPGVLVIPAPVNGESEVDVTVTPVNDALKENVETITVTLLPDPGYVFYNDDATTILLRDDDQPIVSLAKWDDSPTEGGDNSEAGFFIGRTGPTFGALTNGDLTVNYVVTGTALNGVDYPLLSGAAVIPDGASSVDLVIDPVNDALVEGTETLTLTLQPSPDYGLGVDTATVYVTDNETPTPTIGFLATSSTTTEAAVPVDGEFRFVPVTISPPSSDTVTVEYVAASGSTAWANGIDWDLVDPLTDAPIKIGLLTFPPGVTNQNVKLRIHPDNLIEGTEVAAIDIRNARFARVSGSRTKHSLSITDGTNAYSPARVMFITGASAVDEDRPSAPLLMVGLDRALPAAASVNYAVSGGTATAGSDFTLPGGTLNFAPGEVAKSIPLVILNDTTFESDETVIVTLSAPAGADLGTVPSHTVTIRDNDSGTPDVIVTASDATATEGGDAGAFTVTRTSGGAALPLTVNYIVAGTADAGSDYVALSGSVTIPAGQASAPVTVTTLNDELLESTETVTLTIIPDAAYALGAVVSATVSILDDETQRQPPVAFNQNRYVPRNQSTPITLTASDPNGDPLTYQVVAPPVVGALAGVAPNVTYTPPNGYTGPASFTFRAHDGANTSAVATVSITVYNSMLIASNSVWRYSDGGVDLGSGWTTNAYNDAAWSNGAARLGFGDAATTVVRGQPRITYYFRQKFVLPTGVTFTSLVARVQRDDGIVVHVNGTEAFRDNMPSGAITYSTYASASVGGSDETAWFSFNVNPALLQSGTNIIAAEVHQRDSGSSDLGFALELSGYGVPSSTLPSTVIIAATDASATEPTDSGAFTVTRVGGDTGVDLHVAYSVSGSATPGADYAVPSSVLTIPAGQTSATLTVAPFDDFDAEGTETVVVTLAAGLGYNLDTNITATVSIADDDVSRVPPTALPQSISVWRNRAADLTLAGTDPENDPLTYQIVTPPVNGALSGTPPNVTYTPNNNFSGADNFTFRVNDGSLWSSPAVVSITVADPSLLIASNAVWRYNDLGVDLGTGWRATNYNDGSWGSGPARLGFGDNEVTELNGQPVITYYFRHTFVTPADYTVTNSTVSFQRDDGIVVYLNGTEVARDNMPLGTILYSTRATNAPDDQAWYTYPVSAALVRPGTNVLAAEVHQVNSGSSDIGFALSLRGNGYFPVIAPPPSLTAQMIPPNTFRITFPAANGLRYAVEASQNFIGWQALTTNTVSGGQFLFSIQSTNPPYRFFRARQVP